MQIFDGYKLATEREKKLNTFLLENLAGHQLCIASIVFIEDEGSLLYTRFKTEAAQRLGIKYQVKEFSILDSVDQILQYLAELNQSQEVTGIIIQKPLRKTWLRVRQEIADNLQFSSWWRELVSNIIPQKDVDGLHPNTLKTLEEGTKTQQTKVLPATCQAVSIILESYDFLSRDMHYLIIGKSDLLGRPLYAVLKNGGYHTTLIGRSEFNERLNSGKMLLDAQVIVSATGHHRLITGNMIAQGSILIDVGEPLPDFDFESVAKIASFITPVPGGVGPMTVQCLMENCTVLASHDYGILPPFR